MGTVGDFLFGGSQSKESGNSASHSVTQSQNQSQSTSNQGSANASASQQVSGSQSENLAYPALASALMPSLGYVSQGGNMLGALLGLPQTSFNYTGQNTLNQPLLPTNSATGGITLNDVKGAMPTTGTPPPPGTNPVPTPAPTPTPTPTPTPAPSPSPAPGTGGGGGSFMDILRRGAQLSNHPELMNLSHRATGGPVNAGQPYVVGENQPEVFVPQQSGTIIPSVQTAQNTGIVPYPTQPNQPYNPNPGSPSDAVNTYANSAGLGFVLDQGQKALSGASAGNGVFNSGATGKALTQYGQNLGKTYLNDYMNRLLDYSKLGLASASSLSGAGSTNISQSAGTSGSVGSSFGQSQSTSSGTSSGVADSVSEKSGKAHSKKGFL